MLLLSLPLFLIVPVLIKRDSPGPVLVRLTRIGRRGKPFRLYKFRSMVKDAHALKPEYQELNERADGPLFKMRRDPRITRIGKYLRISSIDEIPPLWNVIRGEMSLVGPRPHEPEEVDQYTQGYKRLLSVKPGLTGAAQISGRSNIPFSQEASLDMLYIENWSLWRDTVILLKTIPAIFRTGDTA